MGIDPGDVVLQERQPVSEDGTCWGNRYIFATQSQEGITYVTCDLAYDANADDPECLTVHHDQTGIKLPRGRYTIFEIIEKTRVFAAAAGIELGFVLSVGLSDGYWSVNFARADLPPIEEVFSTAHFLQLMVEDSTGEVSLSRLTPYRLSNRERWTS
jgi:hypothetical protein